MSRIALYAGSFCPFTKGHEDIVKRALPMFDKIIIAIGHNASKNDVFSVEQRFEWIYGLYKDNFKIEVGMYYGLTVNFCRKFGAKYMIRGVRNALDIMNESELAAANKELDDTIETVILFASPEFRNVSSSFVRELWANNHDYSKYLSYKLPDYQSK